MKRHHLAGPPADDASLRVATTMARVLQEVDRLRVSLAELDDVLRDAMGDRA